MEYWDGKFRSPLECTRANAACCSTRLGTVGYCTFQEYVGYLFDLDTTFANNFQFLMDEHLAFLKPGNVSLEKAATVGVGALVSPSRIGLTIGVDLE